MSQPRQSVLPAASGTTFLVIFGAIWLLGGCVLHFGRNWPVYSALLVLTTALGAWSWRMAKVDAAGSIDEAEAAIRVQQRSIFRLIHAAQWSGIVFFSILLSILGRSEWTVVCTTLIVGAHFLLLARIFETQVYYGTGALMIAWGAMYPFVSGGGPMSAAGPLGTGILLWLTACARLLTVSR